MADYISTLNGQQMDSALMDMAEHTSEAYAVGERNGIPVGEDDVAYENNAKYYAQIATSHIEPGQIGDAVRWDTDQSTVLTDANKEQARKNIAAASVNPNMLANWYFVGGGSQLGAGKFPINSRGATYYENLSYMIDRWKSDSPWGSPIKCALQSEGVVLAGDVVPSYPTAYTQFTQILEVPPVGQMVTLSILIDNLSADSEGEYPVLLTNNSVWTRITSTGLTSVSFTWQSGVNSISIIVPDGASSAASLRMQAIKLEAGTVSTLREDFPNFGAEMAKCLYANVDPADTFGNSGFGGSNENLLDNWYFAGEGSQAGADGFPINQRGAYSYSGTQIGFDRWHTFDYSGSMSAELTGGGIKLHFGANGGDEFAQIIPSNRMIEGETYTFTVQYQSGDIRTLTFVFSSSTIITSADQFRFHIIPSWGGGTFIAILNLNANARDLYVKAVKLERGTVSTLVNDPPPNFQQELAKCQHYYWLWQIPSGTVFANGISQTTSLLVTPVATPVPMRKVAPTVAWQGGAYALGLGAVNQTVSSLSATTPFDGYIDIVWNGTFSAYYAYSMVSDANGFVISISCDL